MSFEICSFCDCNPCACGRRIYVEDKGKAAAYHATLEAQVQSLKAKLKKCKEGLGRLKEYELLGCIFYGPEDTCTDIGEAHRDVGICPACEAKTLLKDLEG